MLTASSSDYFIFSRPVCEVRYSFKAVRAYTYIPASITLVNWRWKYISHLLLPTKTWM